jgi:hypothetical protein
MLGDVLERRGEGRACLVVHIDYDVVACVAVGHCFCLCVQFAIFCNIDYGILSKSREIEQIDWMEP